MAIGTSEPTPYLPIVKAIAPKAPSGASFITLLTMPNSTWDTCSTKSNTGLPFSPIAASEKPNRMAISSTCRMSPLAKASMKVVGMMLRMNSTVDWA